MRIISKRRLREFYTLHADAESPIMEWIKKTEHAVWTRFAEVRTTFGSADQVTIFRSSYERTSFRIKRTIVVFNIAGTKYRLIASINYETQIIYILQVMTHAEYITDKWKEQL